MYKMTLDSFLAVTLPNWLSGTASFVVATYNTVNGHEQRGKIQINEGKSLTIVSGGAPYRRMDAMTPNPGYSESKTTDGLMVVSSALDRLDEKAFEVVVLYAGKSRFAEVERLGRKLANRGKIVFLLACGCDDDQFEFVEFHDRMEGIMPNDPICGCDGGRQNLALIVEAILSHVMA
ncbi:MAG: hypothetical protein AAB455_03575 [Patescibacteria group bacterium]